ncbi:MAG: hypothetical protein ACRC0X_05775, partial [Brevinema sp.]
NFSFLISRNSQELKYSANLTLPSKYFPNSPFSIGQLLSISIQFDDTPQSIIFSGSISHIYQQDSSLIINASFSITPDNDLFETYSHSSLQDAITHLVPLSSYEDENPTLQEFVFKGSLRYSLYRILRKKVFFINSQQQLVILDTLTPRNHISPIIKSVSFFSFDIEPIPHLDISDTFTYLNQQFIIIGIHYSNSHTTIHADQYSPQISAPVKIEQTFVASQPLTPLFAPSATQAKRGETAHSLLQQLEPNVKNHLENLAEEVRTDLEDSFETIVITSVFRSKEKQRDDILLQKIKLSGISNMYKYYEKKAPLSAPYLKIIQYLYDGLYDTISDGSSNKIIIPNSDFNAIESVYEHSLNKEIRARNGAKKKERFKAIINEVLEEYPHMKGNYAGAQKILTKSMVDIQPIPHKDIPNKIWNEPLFVPSLHTITNSNGEPASYAIDLRKSDSSKLLSSKHRESAKGDYYDGSSDGEPHYHLTIKL